MNTQPYTNIMMPAASRSCPANVTHLACLTAFRMRRSLLSLLAVGAAIVPAHANGGFQPYASVNGFGTVGWSDDRDAGLGFTREINQNPDPARRGSLRPDSRLGLQWAWQATPRLRTAVQLVAREKVNNSLNASFEWAYLAYAPSSEWTLRAGRLGLDMYLDSETRSVGYTHTAVRPDHSFYAGFAHYAFDGVDLTWRSGEVGAGHWQLRAQFGRTRADTAFTTGEASFGLEQDKPYRLVLDRQWTLSAQLDRGNWRWRVGAAGAQLAGQPPARSAMARLMPLIDARIPGVSEALAGALKGLDMAGDSRRYLTAGTRYDDGDWQVTAELGHFHTRSKFWPQGWSAYLLAARQFGVWRPYVSFGMARSTRDAAQLGGDWSQLGPDGPALQAYIENGLNITRVEQRNLSLGVRWDVATNAALKLQWDRFWIDRDGYALWRVPMSRADRATTAHVVSVALDFIF